jgi:DNA segregation ATPase FtsK/SpoIIIE, S-DNA-T family
MRGGPVRVYGLDYAGGGLQMLQPLPHVGAIIAGDDEERVARLLRTIRDEVDQRAVRYSAARAGSIRDYRVIAKAPDEPRILLLLDGLGAFRDAYESSVSAPWFSVFSQIATDGRQVGVHVIVTGDRSGAIPTSLSSSIQRRLVLRMANIDDYGMLGIDADVLGPLSPPGRGVLDEQEVQIAVLGGDPNVAVQARKIEELAESMRKAGLADAPSVERLPEDVSLSELPPVNSNGVVIGIADDNLVPIGIEPRGGFVIAGPPGSGRTTALWTIAAAVRRADPGLPLYLFSSRRSSLSDADLWTAVSHDAESGIALSAALADKLQAQSSSGQFGVFVENIADFEDSELERDLERLLKLALKSEQFFVAESETSTWPQARTFGRPLRASRRGLILQPEDGDDDLLRATFGRIRRGTFPPGRGYLVSGGRSRKVQVAAPYSDAGTELPPTERMGTTTH